MRKIILTFAIIGVLLLLTACGDDTTTQATEGAFIGGNLGIVATFEPLSVEEEGIFTIFDTEDFPIDVLLKNKGEQDVEAADVHLRLLGPPQEQFENLPNWELDNAVLIEKISEFNPEGGEEIVSFTPDTNAKYTGTITSFTDINWNLEYAYNYKTHLIINDVCFKEDITDDKVCEVKESKTFSVSGAPITVNSVEEDVAGKGIMLVKVEVSNAGLGSSTVPEEEFDNRFDQIAYSISEPEKWECKSGGREGSARLIEGAATIICRLKEPLAEDDIFTKSLELTLDYKYKELIVEKLRVKESVR